VASIFRERIHPPFFSFVFPREVVPEPGGGTFPAFFAPPYLNSVLLPLLLARALATAFPPRFSDRSYSLRPLLSRLFSCEHPPRVRASVFSFSPRHCFRCPPLHSLSVCLGNLHRFLRIPVREGCCFSFLPFPCAFGTPNPSFLPPLFSLGGFRDPQGQHFSYDDVCSDPLSCLPPPPLSSFSTLHLWFVRQTGEKNQRPPPPPISPRVPFSLSDFLPFER